jgi:hypothetical protein
VKRAPLYHSVDDVFGDHDPSLSSDELALFRPVTTEARMNSHDDLATKTDARSVPITFDFKAPGAPAPGWLRAAGVTNRRATPASVNEMGVDYLSNAFHDHLTLIGMTATEFSCPERVVHGPPQRAIELMNLVYKALNAHVVSRSNPDVRLRPGMGGPGYNSTLVGEFQMSEFLIRNTCDERGGRQVMFYGNCGLMPDGTLPEHVQRAIDIFMEHTEPFSHAIPQDKGAPVFVIRGDSRNGYTLSEMARILAPLEEANYTPEAVAGFARGLEALSSDKPFGRIVVFDGPPGTGKSWMVRAIMTASPRAVRHLLVQPHQVPELLTSEFADFLSENCRPGSPINLLIEDADSLLAERTQETSANDRNGVSALLNLGDGLLGQALDIRVTCTTNVPYERLDAAVLRAGRLAAHIKVGPLSRGRASAVLARLTGLAPSEADKRITHDEMVLADVYAIAEVQKRS